MYPRTSVKLKGWNYRSAAAGNGSAVNAPVTLPGQEIRRPMALGALELTSVAPF
jgi:hypothetical protein